VFQNCVPTVSVAGDGIDNDCDNKIDEELCTPDNNQKGIHINSMYNELSLYLPAKSTCNSQTHLHCNMLIWTEIVDLILTYLNTCRS